MLIKRRTLLSIKDIIDKKIEEVFDVHTQYKFLLILQNINSEIEIARTQLSFIVNQYGEKDEQDNLIYSEYGEIKIKKEYQKELEKKYYEIYDFKVQLPDIYFSLDELQELGLTLKELILLKDFIKGDIR